MAPPPATGYARRVSVYRSPRGRWMVDVVLEYADGRVTRVRKVCPAQTKVAAIAYERELRQAILDGTHGRQRTTVADFAARFVDEHVVPRLKPRTVALYRDMLRRFVLPALGGLDVAAVTRVDVERLHRTVGAKHPTTANRVLQLVSVLFARASAWGVRTTPSPVAGIERYRERPKERFLSAAERQRLEAVLDDAVDVTPGAVLAIRLLAATGARLGEILSLRWGMVELGAGVGGRLRLPDSKTGPKVIPLSPQAQALVQGRGRGRGRPGDLVCASSAGTRLTNIERTWQVLRRRADLDDVRLHDLRHSAASDALAAGVPLALVGGILGHRSPRTTARYAHLADDALAAAAAAMGASIERRARRRPG